MKTSFKEICQSHWAAAWVALWGGILVLVIMWIPVSFLVTGYIPGTENYQYLRDTRITWTVLGSVPELGEPPERYFEFVLTNPDSWQRTGVTFERAEAYEEADIVFKLLPIQTVQTLCKNKDRGKITILGCTKVDIEKGIWPFPSRLERNAEGKCELYLSNDYGPFSALAKGNDMRQLLVPRIINHEVGHCFGLDHDHSLGVMG